MAFKHESREITALALRLGIGPTLRRSLSTTNPIESTFSTVHERRMHTQVTGDPTPYNQPSISRP